ncbi:hypothetical protein FHS61_002942 [Altererythrobacter atlanticus]|uniref:Uncharacterized protein n=1 Tax=Croceibacterium atlanticum TaxID=1267766 RepID=A0A0F7KYK5_9SPHN|nr:hypothetical protein [Croceibacterium atlanticum]AKH44322.1 hypothetical protein WYH_03303 [Croceibacterium atlanticum]MBB5733895.1 hypothetical protein [Croceibacterium atlanticum]
MTKDTRKTQAMPDDGPDSGPDDGLKGSADGVNTQAEWNATGGSQAGAPRPDPRKTNSDDDKPRFAEGVFGHGGQSRMGYHGKGQLGDQEVEPGGNPNSGAKEE